MGKKIRISEKQAYIIQDIMKEEDPQIVGTGGVNLDFSHYHKYLDKLADELNGIYSKLMFTTLSEVIGPESPDYHALQMQNHEKFMEASRIVKKAQIELSKMGEEEYDKIGYELEDKLDEKRSLIHNKISIIDDIASMFEKVQESNEDDADFGKIGWTSVFKDIKVRDITPENN